MDEFNMLIFLKMCNKFVIQDYKIIVTLKRLCAGDD